MRDHEQPTTPPTPWCSGSRPIRRSASGSCRKHALGFTLLSDPDHKVAEAYGVWVEKSMYGRKYFGNERTTFVIGPTGKVERVFRKVRPAEHDELVLGALEGSAADT